MAWTYIKEGRDRGSEMNKENVYYRERGGEEDRKRDGRM